MGSPLEGSGDESMKGPKVQFARFENGKLRLFSGHTTENEYIAVSHVFGKKEWLTIPGTEGKILASRPKAKFINKKLPTNLSARQLFGWIS